MPTHYKGTAREVRALDTYIKLGRASSAVQSGLDRALTREGLTENQFGVLDILLHLGPLAQCEIARKLFSSDGNITLVINNLEKAGLVVRQRDTRDRRRLILHLTREGRQAAKTLFPAHLARIVSTFAALTADEQTTLAALCRKLGLDAQQRNEST